jgi:hypothetical protein
MISRSKNWIMATALYMGVMSLAQAQERFVDNMTAREKGGALVSELCTKCHNLGEVARLRQSREQWEDTVYSMISRGAPIFPEEIDVIVDYLGEVFGPDTPL